MVEIEDIEIVKERKGVASTIRTADFKFPYADAVEKFLRDNASLGKDWQIKAAGMLYPSGFGGTDNEGNITGLNIPIGVAAVTLLDTPLITGEQLLRLYEKAGNTNPFGPVYIDFGVQINGEPKINPIEAKVLLEDMKQRGIEIGEGVVPHFTQLRLQANQDSGLAYKLAEDVKEIMPVSTLPFRGRVGKNGLFRASLDRDDVWCASGDLAYSNDNGQMVCYDAEGVAPKKPRDLASVLKAGFFERA